VDDARSLADGDRDAVVAGVIRAMINTENDLIDRHVRTMATFHGLLFAALGFLWRETNARMVISAFCLVGIAVSVLALVQLVTATIAIRGLVCWWDEHKSPTYDGPDIAGFYPRAHPLSAFTSPDNFTPLVFILSWFGSSASRCTAEHRRIKDRTPSNEARRRSRIAPPQFEVVDRPCRYPAVRTWPASRFLVGDPLHSQSDEQLLVVLESQLLS
jgi:hypothetical protein